MQNANYPYSPFVAGSPKRLSYRHAVDAIRIEMHGRIEARQRNKGKQSHGRNRIVHGIRSGVKLNPAYLFFKLKQLIRK